MGVEVRVGIRVGVGVCVGGWVGVAVGVSVGRGVSVEVGVTVGVAVDVGLAVGVQVGVIVGSGEAVGVAVALWVGVAVNLGPAVPVARSAPELSVALGMHEPNAARLNSTMTATLPPSSNRFIRFLQESVQRPYWHPSPAFVDRQTSVGDWSCRFLGDKALAALMLWIMLYARAALPTSPSPLRDALHQQRTGPLTTQPRAKVASRSAVRCPGRYRRGKRPSTTRIVADLPNGHNPTRSQRQ